MGETRPERARYLRRVDLPKKQLAGWNVHFQSGRKLVSRYFADRAYGGREEAHATALRFSTTREQDGGELVALLRRFSRRKNTRSGMPGVARYVRRPPDRGAFWLAHWTDADGHRVRKKFSVAVHGEDMARELAIEARRQATEGDRKRLAELVGRADES